MTFFIFFLLLVDIIEENEDSSTLEICFLILIKWVVCSTALIQETDISTILKISKYCLPISKLLLKFLAPFPIRTVKKLVLK